MKWMSSRALVPLLGLFLALTACSGGGDGGSSGGSSSSSAAEKGVISGSVNVSSSLTSGQSLSVTITADSTTSVAATKSDDYYASEPSSDQTAPTQQLTPTVTVPVDADGNFTAQVPAGTSYSTAVHLSSTLSQKSGSVSRAPAASGLGSVIGDIAVEPGKKIVLNLDDSHLQQPGTVTLQVADAFTRAAVTGATVTLIRTGESALTAADGSLTFDGVLPGNHTLLLESAGYADVTRDFTLAPGQALDLGTLNLNSQSGTVVGQVSAAGFDSLAGIVVYLRGIDGSIYSVLTNASGLYRFERIPAAGGYSVLASANGLRSEKVDNIEVATGATSAVATLQLGAVDDEDAGAITGFARFAERADFAHAGIIVSIEGTDLEAITARDGSFILNNVPAGTYTLNYTDSNHQTATREGVRVVATAATKLAPVVLASVSGGLSGDVRAQGGRALPGAILTISDTGDRTIADDAGSFTFTELQVGSHTLEASLPGYASTTIPVTVAANTTTPIATAIELVPHHFSGRVLLGDGGSGHGGVSVTLSGAATYATVSEDDGGFTFSAVPSGNYQLILEKTGYKTQNLAVYIPAGEADFVFPYDIRMTLNYGKLGGVARLQNAEDHSGTVVTVAGTPYTTQTDISGSWVMSLPEGNYAGGVQYAHAGFISRTDTAAFAIVGEQSTALLPVTLEREVGSISGLVQDDGGSPLGGVTVSEPLSGANTTTGANGSFTLANVPVGIRTVTASLAGHMRGSAEVTVTSGAVSNLASAIVLTPYQFTGTLSLGEGATDHSGVELVLEGTVSKTTFSAADGSFSFPAVPAGNYRLTMSKAGYVSEAINLVLPDVAAYTLPYQVTLAKAEAQMRGIVELSGRNDHGGVIITVIDANAVNHQTVTNTLGQWLIALPTGVTYAEVRYSIADYQGQTTTNGGEGYTLSEGDSLDLGKVVLQPDIGTLSGRIVDDGGTAIAEAQVTMANATHTFTATTDASGDYSRSDVVTGSYTVSVFKAGYGTAQQAGVGVTQGKITTANFTLIANQIVGSVVLEGLGAGSYADIPVVLVDGTGTKQGETTTSANGAFTLNKVVAGTYTLVVNQGGNSSYQVNSIPLTLVGNDGYLFTSAIELRKTPLVADRDLLTFDYIKGANSAENEISYNLVLPTTMPNGSAVKWVSNNPIITNQGVVTIPLSTANGDVVLTATLSSAEASVDKEFILKVPADYAPKFASLAQTITLYEDFGYVFKGMVASNKNGEEISYTITDNTNVDLFESVSIDPNNGEVTLRSKENQHGTAILTVKASSGNPVETATASLEVIVNAVADPVTAEAGADQQLTPDTLVTLDGSGSRDVDGDATYLWEVIASPSGSTAMIDNANQVSATFTPKVAGDYEIRLTVRNSGGDSHSDTLTLRAYPQLTVTVSGRSVIGDITENILEGYNAVFTLTLSHDHDYPITFNFATVDLTAQMYKDYQPQVGSKTFAPGVNILEIEVPVTIDELPEAQEQFTLVLSEMTRLTETSAAATATIDYTPLNLFHLNGKNGTELTNLGQSVPEAKNVSVIGDFNGDGFEDLAVSAPYENTQRGKVTIVFGDTTVGSLGQYDLTTSTITITGASDYSRAGFAVAGAGDFNNDGYDDLLIGAPYDDSGCTNCGTVFVIYGSSWPTSIDLATTDLVATSKGLRISGTEAWSYLGNAVAGAGDVNGDDFADIVLGADAIDASYVVYGGAGLGNVALASPPAGGATAMTGLLDSKAGVAVAGVGDVNGDGYDDVLIGAPNADVPPNRAIGRAYLVYGNDARAASLDLEAMADAGVIISGRGSEDYFGNAVSRAGDFDGDGFNDLLIGAHKGGTAWRGEAFILFGGSVLAGKTTISTALLDPAAGIRLDGASDYGFAGQAVAGAGDVNADGKDDILIGVPGFNGETGRVVLVYGGLVADALLSTTSEGGIFGGDNGFTFEGLQAGSKLGASLSEGGDVSGDGYYDFIAGEGNGGHAYLLFGGNHTNRVTADLGSGERYIGTAAAEVVVGDTGYESIYGKGGADVVSSARDVDLIFVTDTAFARIDGGRGSDSLYFDEAAGQTLDLTRLAPEALRNVENIYFGGSGPNTVLLDATTVRRLNRQAGDKIYLSGGSDDKLQFSDPQNWIFTQDMYANTTYTHVPTGTSFTAVSSLPTWPKITVENVSVHEDLGSVKDVKVRLRRENGLYQSTVDWQLNDGSAWAGIDYVDDDGTITFYEGELVKEVTIKLLRDDKFENSKFFSIELLNPVTAVIDPAPSNSGTITIIDDTIDLSVMQPFRGLTLRGGTDSKQIGYDMRIVGDVNGDGYEDMLVGAKPPAGSTNSSYIVFGGPHISGLEEINLTTLDVAARKGVEIRATKAGAQSVAALGDVNGDGYDDLAIGLFGDTHLVFGAAAMGTGGIIDFLAGVPAAQGVTFSGELPGDTAGYSVAGTGDINGDGYDDIAIGAPYSSPGGISGAGTVYVIKGGNAWSSMNLKDLSTLTEPAGFTLFGSSTSSNLGKAVSGAGDVNGDGFADLLVGEPNATGTTDTYSGVVHLILGGKDVGSTGSVALADAIDFSGPAYRSAAGDAIAGVGDVNRDGYDDLLIGVKKAGSQGTSGSTTTGQVYVVYGRTTMVDLQLTTTPSVGYTGLNGATGYVINGTVDGFGQGIQLGRQVGRLGDINGDGFDDLLLSSVLYNSPTNYEDAGQGKVYVIYGRVYATSSYNISTLDITTGFSILGETTGAYFGAGLGGGGDVNGDGYYDLLMGAYEDSSTNYLGGKAYLIYGGDFLGNTYYVGDASDNQYQEYVGFYYYPKQGNDYVFVYSGPDYAFLGQGDDGIGLTFWGTYSNSMIGKIDGGKGADSLMIAYGTLDLTTIANNRIKGIETLNLHEVEYSGGTDVYSTALTLGKGDLMAMLDSNKHVFSVNGDLGDSITVMDGSWTYNGIVSADGLVWGYAGMYVTRNYKEWRLNGTPIKLRIDTDITSIAGLP